MIRLTVRLLTVAIVALAATTPASAVRLRTVAGGFDNAVLITAPAGDSRLFVVEQPGRVRIIGRSGRVVARPFLDISRIVRSGGEQGLLGLAFHPRFATNRRFFVNYTNRTGATVIAEFRVGTNPNVANPSSRRRLMLIGQPYANHNGGMLAFGRDGYLYIGMGDGGSANDPGNRAQSLRSMLGKLLRIDVNGRTATRGYRIPATNPFRGRRGVPPEIFALGLRNPWRFSFDRVRGDLWIGDVGQNAIEEVDFAPIGRARAANFGWKRFEGRRRASTTGLSAGHLVYPVAQYGHSAGCSVTGGYVYRGPPIAGLNGRYVYADFCSSRIWSMRAGPTPGAVREITGALGTRLPGANSGGGIRAFGQGGDGRLYVTTGATVWRFDR